MPHDGAKRLYDRLSRRDWLRLSGASALAGSTSGWFHQLAARAADDPRRKRACILLWMAGGPSQIDTFDPKPEHANGGQFKAIDTAVPGIQISEHLPKLAQRMQHLALVRSMTTKEGDHARATYLVRTGYPQSGPVQYPALGPLFAKQMRSGASDLPACICISRTASFVPSAFSSGFLGPAHAPLFVGQQSLAGAGDEAIASQLRVPALESPASVNADSEAARRKILSSMEDRFAAGRETTIQKSRLAAYEQAYRMMRPETKEAFDIAGEEDSLRDAYGRTFFGQGCLLARRLVERGVPFVEVTLDGAGQGGGLGWDTHQDNFNGVKALSEVLDSAWSALVDDLEARGLLESTTIVWMGEFGRTPIINSNQGRDHYPNAWSTALCGGGIRGGQTIGRTSNDGTTVEERPVSAPDLLATVAGALGIDGWTQNMSNVGRPIRVVDPEAAAIQECLS